MKRKDFKKLIATTIVEGLSNMDTADGNNLGALFYYTKCGLFGFCYY